MLYNKEASPRSILVFSGRYHIISTASIVNNCIILHGRVCVMSSTVHMPEEYFPVVSENRLDERLR